MGSLINEFLQFFLTVLSILNPIGAIPVFLALTAGYGPEKLRSISKTCAITVTISLFITAISGQYILNFFSVSIDAFRIGGGILILLNALSMIGGKLAPAKLNKSEIEQQKDTEQISIVPLAIPLLVGPGSISTVILATKNYSTASQWLIASLVFVLMGVIVYLTQLFAKNIKKILGDVGVNVMTRIMGLILIALGAEFIVRGIKGSFHI